MTRLSEQDLTVMQGKVRRAGVAPTVEQALRKDKVAGSTPVASSKLYRSKWEEQMAYELTIEKRVGHIKDWGYETMTLKLAKGKRYTPDFTVLHVDGRVECLEIKGHHKNLRDSLTHVKWAAQKHPWFTFTIRRRTAQGWMREWVGP